MINAESYRKLNIPKCRDTLFKGNNFGVKVIESELNDIVTKSRMKPSHREFVGSGGKQRTHPSDNWCLHTDRRVN